ncbi:unnamed protein product, partial [Meganyctiphanes norvegica]
MRVNKIVLTLAAILLSVATGLPQYEDEYDYDYGNEDYAAGEEEEIAEPPPTPHFTITQQHFSAAVGEDVTFPCDVEDLGPYIMFFKFKPDRRRSKSPKTIFVGDMEIHKSKTRPSRYSKAGSSFSLSGVRKFDAGEYICIVEADDGNQEIVHTLDIHYPATVSRVSKETQHVEQGKSVTLECAAEGNPTPIITWSKQGGHMPSGQPEEEGISITLQEVDRYDEGTYICTASNGIGESSKTSMEVMVEYKPEINTEESILHTGKGNSAKLVCIVHGRPIPNVSWYKGGESVNIDRHISSHDGSHRHTLTIDQVIDKDFGEYTCEASNTYGTASSSLSLTGLPKKAKMTSNKNGGEKDSYTLTWTTESFSRPVQLRIKYRKLEDDENMQNPNNWHSVSTLLTGEEGLGLETNGQSHYMRHDLTNLEPATDYEAVVLVENEFGWSSESDNFNFHTRKEVSLTHQATGGCSLLNINLSLVMISILARFL